MKNASINDSRHIHIMKIISVKLIVAKVLLSVGMKFDEISNEIKFCIKFCIKFFQIKSKIFRKAKAVN